MCNREESLAEWFEDNLMHLAYLVSMSPNYSVNDRYVLYDIDHNLILSGDIGLSMILEKVFEEYQ